MTNIPLVCSIVFPTFMVKLTTLIKGESVLEHLQKISALLVLVTIGVVPLTLKAYSIPIAVAAAVLLSLVGFLFFNKTWLKSQGELVRVMHILSNKDPLAVEQALISTSMPGSSKEAVENIIETYYQFLGKPCCWFERTAASLTAAHM